VKICDFGEAKYFDEAALQELAIYCLANHINLHKEKS